jgi:transposase
MMRIGGGSACSPPVTNPSCRGRRNRPIQPAYDEYTYRSRHLIENAFAKFNSSRRIATRYEQTTTAFAAFVALACVFLWLM